MCEPNPRSELDLAEFLAWEYELREDEEPEPVDVKKIAARVRELLKETRETN